MLRKKYEIQNSYVHCTVLCIMCIPVLTVHARRRSERTLKEFLWVRRRSESETQRKTQQ